MNEDQQRRQDAIHAVAIHGITGSLFLFILYALVPALDVVYASVLKPVPTWLQIDLSVWLRTPMGATILGLFLLSLSYLDWHSYLRIDRHYGKTAASVFSVIVLLILTNVLLLSIWAAVLPFGGK